MSENEDERQGERWEGIRRVLGPNAREVIQVVREQVRIDVVVGRDLALSPDQVGGLWGRCPFDGYDRPTLVVTPHRGVFHCRTCGVGGDVISWTMKIRGLGLRGAVLVLAHEYGLDLPD